MEKGISDARLNLARNWATLYGSPSSPQPGAVVVWRHHVGELVEHVRGSIWVVRSGNDGHRVRTRPRSIAGAIAFRSGGVHYAAAPATIPGRTFAKRGGRHDRRGYAENRPGGRAIDFGGLSGGPG